MAHRKVTATDEEMLALREQGLSNKEIAQKVGVTSNTVLKRIGPQPASLTLLNRQKIMQKAQGARAAQQKKTKKTTPPQTDTPVAPQKAASEPPKPVEVKEVKETPATSQKRHFIPSNRLFDFAICANWGERLKDLARMALPEPWTFKNTPETARNPDTVILEQCLLETFKLRVEEFNTTADNPDLVIHMRGKFCCFHTGLYTRNLQGIYMYFEPSYNGSDKPWYFVNFFTSTSRNLARVYPLPEHRSLDYELASTFNPNKSVRVSFNHILGDSTRLTRLPEAVRGYWNLPLLLDTAIEYTRFRAAIEPNVVVTAARVNNIVWLLPIYITNPDTPDIVALIEDMGDYYHCRTCITPEMAYLYARINGRPTASWLTALLDDGGGELKGVTPTYGGEIRPHADPQTGVHGARRL